MPSQISIQLLHITAITNAIKSFRKANMSNKQHVKKVKIIRKEWNVIYLTEKIQIAKSQAFQNSIQLSQ